MGRARPAVRRRGWSTSCELGPESLVVEVASNDGYLLQHFRDRGIGVLGIEPAANIAAVAERAGIPTLVAFFGAGGRRRARRGGRRADLIVANNVLAQVPDLHDFVAGLARLLAPDGLLTLEFPHVAAAREDPVRHDLSRALLVLRARDRRAPAPPRPRRRRRRGAADARRIAARPRPTSRAGLVRRRARRRGRAPAERPGAACFDRPRRTRFGHGRRRSSETTVEFLETARQRGRSVAGYGAPGKATTFLAYCGIGTDLLPYTVDRNPHKHGMFMPGTRTPIAPVERLAETRPDYIWILPWNLRDEIAAQLADAGSGAPASSWRSPARGRSEPAHRPGARLGREPRLGFVGEDAGDRERCRRARRRRVADVDDPAAAAQAEVVDERPVGVDRLGPHARRPEPQLIVAQLRNVPPELVGERPLREVAPLLGKARPPKPPGEAPEAGVAGDRDDLAEIDVVAPVAIPGEREDRVRAGPDGAVGRRVKWIPRNGNCGSGTG